MLVFCDIHISGQISSRPFPPVGHPKWCFFPQTSDHSHYAHAPPDTVPKRQKCCIPKTSRSSKNFKMHACADQQRRRQCFVCGASTTKHCICGATFIKDHDAIALHKFVAFVYRAPVGAFDEAEDNVRLLTAFKALHKRRVVTLQGAMRLAALAGITGKTETVV